MSGIFIKALLCPDCQKPLQGLRYDKVFFCLDCRQGLLPDPEKGWERFPLAAAEPPRDLNPNNLVYLPFWRFPVTARAEINDKRQTSAAERIAQQKFVWVMGFTMLRPSYFGDPGLLYTERNLELPIADQPPPGVRLAGCSRGPEEVRPYIKLFLAQIFDRKADITGAELFIKVQDPIIVACPFIDLGEKLKDPATGTEISAVAFEDLEGLRDLRRSR